MGLIERLFSLVFGGGNVIKDTAEVFRENAEGKAVRQAALSQDALAQFAAEFIVERKGLFDRFMDGINRVPRPALALGTIALFISAMVDPIWFAERMQGIALVPEPLWWLLGAIVSFYFGARHQTKGQEFQRSIAATMARAPEVAANIERLRDLDPAPQILPETARIEPVLTTPIARSFPDNAALEEWSRTRDK
jgi:hypothetical protein